MRRLVRPLTPLVVAAGIVAALLVAPSAASGVRPAAEVPALAWQPCASAAGFECAGFPVPLDYDDPQGATITLAVIRHVATDPSHRMGSLFYNPGGPGSSGVDDLPETYDLFPAQVRADFDIVSFDPRGVAGSAGVSCFATPDEETALLSQAPTGFPVGANEQRTWIDVWRQFGQACGANAGPLLAHMSTANVARDMDLLRQAVGDARLSYLGISYGTYLGATYANLFPTKVRAMVLDSNIDAAAWADPLAGAAFGTFLRIGSDIGSAQTLSEFTRECGQVDSSRCAFSAGSPQATQAKLDTLLIRLRSAPIDVLDTTVTYSLLVAAIVNALYVVSPNAELGRVGWSGLANVLQVVWAASANPAVPAHGAASAVRALHLVQAPQVGEPSYYAGLYGILCSDSPNPRPAALYPAQEAFANARSGAPGSLWTWDTEPCADWPVQADQDRYLGPFDRPTAAPILLLGITHDPATPYQDSVNMSHELANARLLTIEGSGHTSLLNPSTCALDAEAAYLVSGVLPQRGAVCNQDQPAFP